MCGAAEERNEPPLKSSITINVAIRLNNSRCRISRRCSHPLKVTCHFYRRTSIANANPHLCRIRANRQWSLGLFAEKTRRVNLSEFESNRRLLERSQRISPFDSLSLTLVPEESGRIALVETDKIDIAPIDTASIDRAKSSGFVIDGPKHVVSTALRFFMSYDEDFLTSSLEFRKALAFSANMPEIVAAAYPPEAASLATGSALFTPVSPGYHRRPICLSVRP